MDKVFISQLKIDTVIGVYDWEKEIKQSLFIDLEMWTDITMAAANDDIDRTVDYAKVSDVAKNIITAQPTELIETLAERVATALLQQFPVFKVKVRVNKPGAVPEAENVGVEIIRSNSEPDN